MIESVRCPHCRNDVSNVSPLCPICAHNLRGDLCNCLWCVAADVCGDRTLAMNLLETLRSLADDVAVADGLGATAVVSPGTRDRLARCLQALEG